MDKFRLRVAIPRLRAPAKYDRFSVWCCNGATNLWTIKINSLTPKSIPAGTKLVLFGRYVLNIYVGIVRYFLRTTKTQRAKIYLPTQRTNW